MSTCADSLKSGSAKGKSSGMFIFLQSNDVPGIFEVMRGRTRQDKLALKEFNLEWILIVTRLFILVTPVPIPETPMCTGLVVSCSLSQSSWVTKFD